MIYIPFHMSLQDMRVLTSHTAPGALGVCHDCLNVLQLLAYLSHQSGINECGLRISVFPWILEALFGISLKRLRRLAPLSVSPKTCAVHPFGDGFPPAPPVSVTPFTTAPPAEKNARRREQRSWAGSAGGSKPAGSKPEGETGKSLVNF